MDVIVVVVFVLTVFLLSSVIIVFVLTATSQFPLDNRKPVLVVTAHPDDECMFFAPAILRASKNSNTIFILCLSNGTSK